VAASFQTPTLFLIAQDLTKMQVNANVSESDIGGLREGQTAHFSVDAYPERQFEGTVVQVRNAPTTVQNVVTYDVVIAVDNPSGELKPGMTATVAITADQRRDALRVPLRALRFRPEGAAGQETGPRGAAGDGRKQQAVWRLTAEGTLERVPVTTGLRDERRAEILSGDLAPGDAVVVAMQTAASNERPSTPPPFAGGGRRR
jgi:HlyD family secretion protein